MLCDEVIAEEAMALIRHDLIAAQPICLLARKSLHSAGTTQIEFFWMMHCPPALFKLPQNSAASSADPNGPTMVR
jgi:hypothetical protein